MSPLCDIVMNTGHHKPMMFAVVLLLTVSLVYSSFSTFYVYAVPADSRFDSAADCKGEIIDGEPAVTCCWREPIPGSILGEVYCQSCFYGAGGDRDCDPKELQVRLLPEGDLPQLETVPPNRTLPFGGDLPTLGPTLEPGPGFNQGTEGEPPLPVVCSEEAGLEKDPETGQCVPIESPVTEEQPEEAPEEEPEEEEQPEPEEEQPSEESDSEDNGNN